MHIIQSTADKKGGAVHCAKITRFRVILAREGLVIFTQQLQHVVTLAIARATPLPFPMYASALQNPIVFQWDLDVLAALHLRRRRRAERIVRRHDHEGEHHLGDDVEDRVRHHLPTRRLTVTHPHRRCCA